MRWRSPLAVVVSTVALLGATAAAVQNGRDGTPSTTLLTTSARRSAAPASEASRRWAGRCRLDRPASASTDVIEVTGACDGPLRAEAVCGDATGSVAFALSAPTSAGSDLYLTVQLAVDPLTEGPTQAALFTEMVTAHGFDRWSDRSVMLTVTADGRVHLGHVRLDAEPGTVAPPIVLDGVAACADSA